MKAPLAVMSNQALCRWIWLATALVSTLYPGMAAARGEPDTRPTLPVPVTGAAPVVDGKLDEACWQRAAATGPLKDTRGRQPKSTTEAFIVRDADHLYVGVRCTGGGPRPGGVKRGNRKWGSQYVELAIDTNADGNSYYLIRIGPAGRAASSYNEDTPPWHDRTWQPSFRSAVARGAGMWSAECALPWNIFNKNKTRAAQIGFNIVRSGLPGKELQCWHGAPQEPGRWGRLMGIPPIDKLPRPEYSRRGLSRFYPTPSPAKTSFVAEEAKRTISLGPGSSHAGTTGEVRLELEGFLLEGDPHARGIIWDLAVDEQEGELYMLADTRKVRGVAELKVFDRQGRYVRTVMPLNPTLPRSSMQDLCRKTAREGGTELIVPKQFLSWGETTMYGPWWHHPQKMALAPNGDLILSNLYKGILWRLRPDGRLPETGWTSVYHRERNEPFDSIAWTQEGWHCHDLKNHLPFHALHYPYFCFAPDGLLYVSAGQNSHPTKRFAYVYEVHEREVKYHWPEEGARGSHVWKCRLEPGPRVEKEGVINGFSEASGIVVDGEHLIVADAGHNRLQVCTPDGKPVASITHYEDRGQKRPLYGPTALATDRDRSLYVLIGSEERPRAKRSDKLFGIHRPPGGAAAKSPPEPPRRVIKLKNWKTPELLAASAPLHQDVLQIAVDAGVSPPLVWVANGEGPGNLQQLSGEDLSVKGRWQEKGDGLSNPRQSGNQPILNIDPETGDLYVEDDSNYRLKQYGTVYRIDQQGKVRKRWAPLFIDAPGLNILSPWGKVDYRRHFRYPEEPLFIDSIFGKDGLVYRWKLDQAGVHILRSDRTGKPVPFAATGSNALFVEPPIKSNICWWDVYSGMDVDRQGNIYYSAKVDSARTVTSYQALHRQINVYDVNGKLRKKALLRLDSVRGIQVDGKGNLYVIHSPAKRPWKGYMALSKFSPSGGRPLWSRRWEGNPGMGQQPGNPPCICTINRLHQALDGKGYLYAAGQYSVQVISCETGKWVGEFGSYGNLDCGGKGSPFPHPELPFGSITAISVWKDRLFALDEVNRRIVKCRIVYDPAKRSDAWGPR